MKKTITQFLALLLMVLVSVSSSMGASLPSSEPATQPAATPSTPNAEPNPDAVKAAVDEFKSLSRHDQKNRIKEAKKAFKEYRAEKRSGRMDDDSKTILLVICAILLPPLAVALKEDGITVKFWICLLLTLLTILLWPFWLLAALYALLVVFDQL